MSDPQTERFGDRVQVLAAALAYPPTPDVAGRVRARLQTRAPAARPDRRRLALAGLALVAACLGALAVPQVRAALVDFIQIGVVRIFVVPPTATPTPTPPPTGTIPPAPAPTPTILPSLLDLAGRTTLADARQRSGFSIPLPTYPAGLGQPDYVFLQQMDKPMVVLVWIDPAQPARVRLSLHIISPGSFAVAKVEPTVIQTTTVNGQAAVWAEGPYLLRLTNENYDVRRLINGHVLIWESDGITYRIETDESLSEAIKIAESLK